METLDIHPCPICGQNSPLIKKWTIRGQVQVKGEKRGAVDKQRHNAAEIRLYKCANCNKTFRKGFRVKAE